MYNLSFFSLFTKVAIREMWNKNIELEQFEAFFGETCSRTYLIATEDIENSYALLKLICTDRSFHRCVVIDGMIDLWIVSWVGVDFWEILEGKVAGRLKAGLVSMKIVKMLVKKF